jgi:hypothetical protein
MIGNLAHKIEELDNLLVDAIENYHDPSRFFTYSHSLIQACRNFTFAVQANKGAIPEFDKWYSPWQENMKSDSYMKWLQKQRTEVVHSDIIASKSYARLITISDYKQLRVEESYDYRKNKQQIIDSVQERIKSQPSFAHSTISIERKYVAEVNGQEVELVELLAYAFYYLSLMYGDLDVYLKKEIPYAKIPSDLDELIRSKIPKNGYYRYFSFKARSGEELNRSTIRIDRDEKEVAIAKKKYGTRLRRITGSMSLEEAAKIQYANAKNILLKDGHYLSNILLKTPGGYQPTFVAFRDRSEKLHFSHEIPSMLMANDADGIMFISEVWIIDHKKVMDRLSEGKDIGKARNKKEALSLMMLVKDGTTMTMTTEFTRVGDVLTFADDVVEHPDPQTMSFLAPAHLWWSHKSDSHSH